MESPGHTSRPELSAHSELVIGITAAVGTNVQAVEDALRVHLGVFGYAVETVRISQLIEKVVDPAITVHRAGEQQRLSSLMDAGNHIRRTLASDALARLAIARISQMRPGMPPRRAYIVRSLKHWAEVDRFSAVYGPGFMMVGAFEERDRRHAYLKGKGIDLFGADALIERDENEEVEWGQHLRGTFHLADVFIDVSTDFSAQLGRFLDLLFGRPELTPTPDEYAMYQAFAASLRSADLSRQVGAAIVDRDGEVLSIGCNDVPRAGGGLYWPGSGDHRDHRRGCDANHEQRAEIVADVVARVEAAFPGAVDQLRLLEVVQGSRLADITEYGRAVHAEMEAILSAGRKGVTVRDGTLYATTFPCHNCAKHIVAAGIRRVVYIEPYPKSKALDLHGDAIRTSAPSPRADAEDKRVAFTPFIGVGPRHFFDLFSVRHGASERLKRASDGKLVAWDPSRAHTRLPLLPMSYFEREGAALMKIEPGRVQDGP